MDILWKFFRIRRLINAVSQAVDTRSREKFFFTDIPSSISTQKEVGGNAKNNLLNSSHNTSQP